MLVLSNVTIQYVVICYFPELNVLRGPNILDDGDMVVDDAAQVL